MPNTGDTRIIINYDESVPYPDPGHCDSQDLCGAQCGSC